MNWKVTLIQADKVCPPPTEFSGAYITGGEVNVLLLPDAYREAIAYAFGERTFRRPSMATELEI